MSDLDDPYFGSVEEKALWIEGVLADHRDGVAAVGEIEKLRVLLLKDSAARRLYLEANQLSCLLETVSHRESQSNLPAQESAETPPHFNPRVLWVTGLAAAAVAIVVVGLWLSASLTSRATALATLSDSYNAMLSGTAKIDGSDIEFGKGGLTLSSGMAELEFRNGTLILLDGSCGLELIDGGTVRLYHGSMRVRCPFEARGFEVLVPGDDKIIDLGTEFGVSVMESGDVDLHVFDGAVDLSVQGQEERTVEAGSAISISESRELSEHLAVNEMFTTIDTLKQKRWESYRQTMLKRNDLLLYYDFSESETLLPEIEPNRAQAQAHGSGHIVGASRVAGRIPGKRGLLFDYPGDALAFELKLPAVADALTIAMWVKIDRFEQSLSTLLDSNGWHSGDLHFQITKEGNIRSGVNGIGAFQTESGTVSPGEWSFVVVSWHFGTNQARFSCNGTFPQSYQLDRKVSPGTKLKLSTCQIGAWGDPHAGHPPKNRDFKGRIDEVMVFSKALTDAEIVSLYRKGRP